MAPANGSISLNTKQLIVSSLSKRLNLDPKNFLGDMQTDIKSLCINILKSSENGTSLVNNDEVMKWISFAENFPIDSEASFKAIQELNADLGQKSVLMGGGLRPSEVDIIVFSALYPSVLGLSGPHRDKFPHLMRWIDFIQNVEDFGESFERISVEKAEFEPYLPKVVAKVEVDSNAKQVVKGTKDSKSNLDAGVNSDTSSNVVEVDSKAKRIVKGTKDGINLESGLNSNKSADVKKAASDNKATSEKKKLPEKEADEKDKEISVSLLKIQVGQIRKAWKHPSADSLLVEEIDVGDKVRQVVSGLAKYCSPDELMNRRVVLVTNVKPGKLRDVMSEGLVLCASSEDHTIVEPLTPPEGAKVGESISFSGYEGKPEDVLNPKKKQLEKITPHLFTTDTGVATFKGIPFMTSGGPCTSSIPNGSIK